MLIIFPTDFCVYRQMFADIANDEDVRIVDSKSCFAYKLFSIQESIERKLSIPMTRKRKMLFKWICEYAFRGLSNDSRVVVLFIGFLWPIESGLLEYIVDCFPNVKLVCYETDLIKKTDVNFYKQKYDLVLDYDKGECEKFGFEYYGTPNSRYRMQSEKPIYDVCFVGQAKDRLDEILEVYDYFESYGIKCDFWVLHLLGRKQRRRGIHYKWRIPYSKNFKIISKSRCILEITQKGAIGYTTRATEALLYDKLLITNNIFFKDQEGAIAGNVLVYESPSDIDCNRLQCSDMKRVDDENKELLSPKFLKQKLLDDSMSMI